METKDALIEETPAIALVDLPLARLQIVQAHDVVNDKWLKRERLEPTLAQNADGLWLLMLRRQGAHSQFEVPYISSEIILAEPELGLVVVLVGWHGTTPEKYGKRGYFLQKGQFYRYYQQMADGTWGKIEWREIPDMLRLLIIDAVERGAPAWARTPGKLRADYLPPSKPVKLTSYKVVRYIEGRYFSLYDPEQEYILGQRVKQPAKPKHGGGFFSYPTIEMGTSYLVHCAERVPFHREVATAEVALLECEIGGRIINYGHKMASTYLRPLRVLEVRIVEIR